MFGDEDKATAGDVAGGALTATGPDGVRYALIKAEIKGSPMDGRRAAARLRRHRPRV